FYIQNKGLIFKIEEDEYFFRKYVIIYTADSIKNINPQNDISSTIHQILLTDNRINFYQQNNYSDVEFFVAMQLMIKLPFLTFQGDASEFEPINKKLDHQLHGQNLSEVNDILTEFINQHDVISDQSNDYFDNLESAFL